MANKPESEAAIKLSIRHKIQSGEYVLTEQDKKLSTKSVCWKSYKVIKEATTGTLIGYVHCIQCKGISKYDSARTGTSHLLKHLDRCEKGMSSGGSAASKISRSPKGKAAAGTSKSMTSFFKTAAVTMKMKKAITKALVVMCALDMRAFDAVKGKGFEIFCEVFMKLIATHGLMDINALLPHPTTISRNLKITAKETRQRLVPLFQKMMNDGFCAATTDMWTDNYKKISYTTVTLHYTDSDWGLVRRVLFTCAYPEKKKKTAANIREELILKFTSLGFNIDVLKKNVIFVTDQGPNIVKALEEPFKRMNCSSHILNTVLRTIFKRKNIMKYIPQLHKTITATKALVGFLKHSGLSSRLKSTVHQEVETRWNSRLLMFKSVYNNFNEITNIITERDHDQERLRLIRLPILKILIDFLEPFKTASDALEADSATINCVLPEFNELLFTCKPTTPELPVEPEMPELRPQYTALIESGDDSEPESSEDQSDNTEDSDMETGVGARLRGQGGAHHIKTCDIMEYLKAEAYNCLKKKFVITDRHKIATLLTPISKELGLHETPDYPGISLRERIEVIAHLRLMVLAETREDLELPDSQSIVADSQEMTTDISNPVPSTSTSGLESDNIPQKKLKVTASQSSDRLQFLMAKAYPKPVVPVAQHEDEVDRYLKMPCDFQTKSDALQWWRSHSGEFPILSKVARRLLCIPASSASSERVFSAAGYVVQERRSCLTPETVDSILFLNSNINVKEFLKTVAGEDDTSEDSESD